MKRGFELVSRPRETEAEILLVSRAEGEARRGADILLRQQPLGEIHARAESPDAREGVERALRHVQVDAWMGRQYLHHRVAPGPVALAQFPHQRFALFERGDPGALHDGRRAGIGAFRIGGHLLAVAGGHHHPAEPPAGHCKRLGEAVEDDQRVVGSRNLEEGGRRVAVEYVAVIDLVREDDDAALAAEVEQPPLFRRRHDPTRRVAGRVDEERAGVRARGGEHVFQVQRPAVGAEPLAHEGELRARHLERPVDVRPIGADDQRMVARADGHAGRQEDSEHGGAGHRQPVRIEVDTVDPVEISLDCREQVGPAARVVVEGETIVDGLLRCVANEVRGNEVAFPEPQRNDIGIADPGQRHPCDPVLLKRFEFLSQQDRFSIFDDAAP